MTHPLTEHFSLEELTLSQEAARRGIDNTPGPAILANLQRTAQCMEDVRRLLGSPITVSSGYRSPALNAAIGGAVNSAHMDGHAVDFICPAFGEPLDICRYLASCRGLAFDQVIQEGTWVHISFAPALRRQLLTKGPHGTYELGIHPTN